MRRSSDYSSVPGRTWMIPTSAAWLGRMDTDHNRMLWDVDIRYCWIDLEMILRIWCDSVYLQQSSIYLYMHTYTHTRLQEYIHIHAHTYTSIHTHTVTYTHTYTKYIHTYRHMYTHAHVYINIPIYTIQPFDGNIQRHDGDHGTCEQFGDTVKMGGLPADCITDCEIWMIYAYDYFSIQYFWGFLICSDEPTRGMKWLTKFYAL